MATMIEVDNLGKKYRLGGQDKYYKTLRESLVRGLKRPFQKLTGTAPKEDEFWALRNVSFTVSEGEVVGIIGRNGAGKSTLLKLLSRITRPTEGAARLYGRVGSLLEVGTGFHPELTGRENIFLSGNLLGMTRAEVKDKFDEIVAFAEIERFLDTPVKHYSSGMYVRLGFAIAAHLEPEILLVDEVLAVGDAQFQKKCLGKMDAVAKTGRTVLFVSHNMGAVRNLCQSCCLIQDGELRAMGDTEAVCASYLESLENSGSYDLALRRDREGAQELSLKGFSVTDINNQPLNILKTGEDACFLITVSNPELLTGQDIKVSIGIDNIICGRVCLLGNQYTGEIINSIGREEFAIRFMVPKLQLLPGQYSVNIQIIMSGGIADYIRYAGSFLVAQGDYYGTGSLPLNNGPVVFDHSVSCANGGPDE